MLILLLILIITNEKNEPLTGVKVKLEGTDKVLYSDIKGRVSVPSGFDLTVDYISYRTKTIKKDSIRSQIILTPR
jgi:hypothetical protein